MLNLNIVIDTNVFIRELLGSSLSCEIIQALKKSKFNLIISAEIFDEFLDVISRPKFHNIFIPEAVSTLIEIIKTQAKFVTPQQKVTICRDIEDQKILECALEGANFIVTNDNDLLSLKQFNDISILSPHDFLCLLSTS